MSTQTDWTLRHQQLIADCMSAVMVVLVTVSVCIHAPETVDVCMCVYTTDMVTLGYGTFQLNSSCVCHKFIGLLSHVNLQLSQCLKLNLCARLKAGISAFLL